MMNKTRSGLTVRPEDCVLTQTIKAALYATDLKPTEDDVSTLVNAVYELMVADPGGELSGEIFQRSDD